MAKVQNFSEISPNLPFTEYDFYDLYRQTFENSELGKIKANLPLREMAENFGLTNRSMRAKVVTGNQEYIKIGNEATSKMATIIHQNRQQPYIKNGNNGAA